jgi:chromosome segregation protein
MYLSKIEIIGFKSFAQRIEVSFDAGVTAIVGPNGCGKTNIVDAIRWALGEQRYSTLRSDKMEDVIFNGTKTRKPLGLAEVSLTIENTKGILPTEYSEVTVTRRVFRSGESEYQLNKVSCRLKDILDLFMDTGMGSDAYSVIELKMVESILSDKTDERRRLFEEAAGVTKYKHRRKAALRKLEDVQADLMRVNDIVKEVQKTVSTLERQAKKAEQYNDVATRLKTLEVDLLEREYAYLQSKLTPLEARLNQTSQEKSVIDRELHDREERLEQLRVQMSETEQQLTEKQQAVAVHADLIHRIEEKILIANERKSSLQANIERFTSEKTELHRQEGALTQETVSLNERSVSLSRELVVAEADYARAKEEYLDADRRVGEKKGESQALKDAVLTMAHDIVRKRGEQERLKTRMDNLKGRIDRSTEDNDLYDQNIKRNEESIAQLTAHDKELRKRFAEAEMQLFEQEKSKKDIQDAIDTLQKRILENKNEIERRKSKIDFIRRMIETNEGFSQGVKYLLNHEGWKKKKIATIGDVIEAQEKYRPAVEAALADLAHVLVVDTVEDGYAAVEELKRHDQGKATFICLQWVPRLARKRKTRARLPYVWANDVVQCEDRYRPLMNFLLDDVVIVDTMGVAREIFASLIGVRCISLDGQVVSSMGVIRGGSRRLDEGGMIGKKSQMTELENEIAVLEKKSEDLLTEQNQLGSRHDAIQIKSYLDAVKAIEKEMTSAEMRIAQLEFEKRRANDGIERNRTEITNLEHETLELKRDHEIVSAEVVRLEDSKQDQEVHAQRVMLELESLQGLLSERTKAVNDFEIKVVTLQGEIRNAGRDIDRATARMSDISVTLRRRDEEIAHAHEEIGRLAGETEKQTVELELTRQQLVVLEQEKKDIDQSYHAQRNNIHQIELKIKDERRLHDDTTATVHELEMKSSEVRSNIEHLKLRAKEEFELDLQLKEYPEDEWVDFAQRREEVKNLKDRIRVLGAINFAAFDEFTAESERLSFMTQQRDDLLEAEKTLLNTIDEINTTAQRIFMETFTKIRENFVTIFKELFMEGDECDLLIEENVDPLEATIEIIAKPRGKRPTSIDLLSGGEKTLTAIALLFAIYLVKPSPFCILDEVDAPLDDSNIDRFTRILKKFSNNTQFIVVTHNKRTMEAASALYGVTMEEEGISKIVTVRFNEEARVRSATVTN